jgi:transcriptional regulator with XRE-family HTH domain
MTDTKKIDYQKIGQRIKETREAKGMSQGELGAKLTKPLTPTAISLYERGGRDISLETLAEIANLLGISMQDFIEGYKEAPPIHVALRADKNLTPKAREQIMDFIEFIKRRQK